MNADLKLIGMQVEYNKLALMCQHKQNAVQMYYKEMKAVDLQIADLEEADKKWKEIEDVRTMYKKQGWKGKELAQMVNKDTGGG